jgi:hypothetical protein
MLALLVGTILAVGALAYVLFPLLVGSAPAPRRVRRYAAPSAAREQDAVVALREIEFDRATGKLSDGDYDELRTRYTQQALAALRVGDAAQSPEDEAEAAVSAFRSQLKQCATCGPRPEPDATYCSSCGKFLPGACGSCGASVTEPGAAFCTSCGRQLAA